MSSIFRSVEVVGVSGVTRMVESFDVYICVIGEELHHGAREVEMTT